MADPLVGATAQVLLEKLLSLAMDNIGLVFGFKKEMESLKELVTTIQAVLADAENQQRQLEAVKLWLKKIEGVAYEADDVLDELNYELLRRRVKTTQYPLQDKVCFFFCSSITVAFRWRMARKVRDINMKLKLINEKASGFGLQSHLQVVGGSNTTVLPITSTEVKISRETDSVVDQNVVGRATEASKIVEKLLSPSAEAVSFIPITGMGGLGKTTLAKSVYNDAQIGNYFDRKIWVCVSDNFDVTRIFKEILESLRRKKEDSVSRDVIVQEIKKELEGKKYLLVLDDVWCDSSTTWDDFLRSLVGISTAKGNWSLVTTRLLSVASIVTANPRFTLEKLSDDDCWTILKGKAFPSGEVPEELNAIKEVITGACGGLPLAAIVIGGLLRTKAKEEWLSIIRKDIPNMTGDITQILRLSFDYLPSASIKKCFAYCSLFAKDSDMEKNMLIQLWMAEGFLQSDHGNEMEMEAIGSRYFDNLVKSSLIQEVKKEIGVVPGRMHRQVGEVIYGRMHDLAHDLAQKVSRSENINVEQGMRNDNCPVRYFVLESLQEDTHGMLKERSSFLRTLFVNCDISNDLLLYFKCLRVLDLSRSRSYIQLPDSVSKLIHLRYLGLSYTEIEALPESLCKLYNLQTLRISECDGLRTLPEGMSNLISLRHFYCDRYTERCQMPLRMGNLTNLQTLEFFNIGREKGRQIEEIGGLTNLRGTLIIRNIELVNGKEGARLANLSGKSKLIHLKFEWGGGRERENDDENVLQGLEPNPSLKSLEVENFMGSRFPSWMMKMELYNLVNLRLSDCKRCEEIPALGQLPLLKSLELVGLDNLRCIGFAFYGVDNSSRLDQLSRKSFPALQSLELKRLSNLVDWMGVETVTSATGEAVEVFPKLEELIIRYCPKLATAPNHFPCLKRLEMERGDSNTELLLLSICTKVSTLTHLFLYDEGLSCVPDVVISNNQNLVSLQLYGCSNLTHVSRFSLSACENLEELALFGCHNLKSVFFSSGHQLPSSLLTLYICECNELLSLTDELLLPCTSLKSLEVSYCNKMVSCAVDLQHASSLSSLELSSCPNLIAMPRGFASCTTLRKLTIDRFSDSVEFDWSELSSSSVHELTLCGYPRSVSVPDQLQQLTAITALSLKCFGWIESLPDWLENLVSLESLQLFNCEKLMYLPSAEAMRRLTNLRELWIYDCPVLKERCNPSISHDSEWSKISHIPDIVIDWDNIKS